jgi:Domain of unknown function (DUF4424)
MTILKVYAFSLVLFAVALACGRAGASESLIELATGGLDFARSRGVAPIVLESETVAISPVRVVFKYRISTPGPGPVGIDLAFRYPDLDFSDPDATYAIPGGDAVNFLGANLTIAGAPAVLALSQTASLDGKNVTAALNKVHLPMVPVGDFRDKLAATPAAVRNVLAAEGLIKEAGTSAEGEPLLFPAWTVKTEGAAKMTVEPAKPVDIELAYRPSVGIRQDSLMRKALRDNKDLAAEVMEQKRLFCADPAFLEGLDALAGADEANVAQIREMRVRIRMRDPGAPPMPAVAYRLSVDKGKESRIVSFCAQNLKKISPTIFVAKMSNHVPNPEFNLLMIEGKAPPPSRRAPAPRPVAPFVGGGPAGR